MTLERPCISEEGSITIQRLVALFVACTPEPRAMIRAMLGQQLFSKYQWDLVAIPQRFLGLHSRLKFLIYLVQ